MKQVHCLNFSINERFDLSISDLGKQQNEVLIFDKEKQIFVEGFQQNLINSTQRLEIVIARAKEKCNEVITQEIFKANEHLLIK